MKSLDGLDNEFCIAGSIEGHIFAMFLGTLMLFPLLSVILLRNLFSRIASQAYELHIRCHILAMT